MKVRIGALLVAMLAPAGWCADPTSLVAGDPLACFNRFEGSGTFTRVSVSGMPFTAALHVKTGAVADNANAWDIRPRCFNTLAAKQDDTVAAAFWMRTISAASGKGLTTFVVEQGVSPYTKSVTYTAAAQSDWKRVEVPFTMAQTYAAGGYNLSFWCTFANQEIEIGGFTILNYGPGVPFSQLGLTAWPYDGHAADASWRAAAAERIERYRKADIAIAVKDDAGNPVANAPVHVKMKRHAFGFGTAVAGDIIQRDTTDGQNYRDALKTLFNKVVTENALKWPFFEGFGRAQADFMLPWFTANGIRMVRGHNVLWPGMSNLPADVQVMLKANPVDQNALRTRINNHIAQVMAYARGKLTEWDVLNEPYSNKDVQAVLGDAEMAAWFKQARAADPSAKLYINDYSNVESGGYDLPHINGYYAIIQKILAAGGPIDGIGLQSHFNSNLTPPDRVLEVLDRFAALGKDLQITEFDINIADEQIQADYTRDFMTVCFSHPAIKGFLMWGFWEGAHWLPRGAMIRRDWSKKPNYDVWTDLIFHQWWTDVRGTSGPDGIFRTRGFLGDYDIETTVNGVTRTTPLTVTQNAAGAISPNGVVNAASFQPGPVAPGEMVTLFGSGFGPAEIAAAEYDAEGQLPRTVGDTRVLFDGAPARMVYSLAGQVSAIVPDDVSGATQIQVEYQGVATPAVSVPVVPAAPGAFTCGKTLLLIAGGKRSCDPDFVPPRAGDAVTIFITGEGVPAQPLSISFAGIPVTPCAASFLGPIYPGVTQVNTCLPDGVVWSASIPVQVAAAAPVVWSDEFNGVASTPPDPGKWAFDLGGGGWGNQELEAYTNSRENVFQDGNGRLVIRAVRTDSGYTSARLKTQGKFDVQYGRVEARIKIPSGQGIWPAFWMLGSDIGTVGWPVCGEIDIMENIGREPATIHGTVHGPGYSGGNGIGRAFTLASGKRFADDFHVYGIEWSPQAIKFFVDGSMYFEVTPASLPAGKTWAYQHPFFLLLNLAVGGTWPGNPDASSSFPQDMLVDWVRVSKL